MMAIRGRMGLIPPMLAGFVAAIALETSAGVLLYTVDGFLPALTIILTVEVGALGLGVWGASSGIGGVSVEQLRLRWLFCLVVFALAAALAVGNTFMPELAGSGLGQGVGLGFLGGLPLFSLGSLLGAMNGPDGLGQPLLPRVGAPAILGAALGFFLAGSVLLPHAAPYTIYLVCLVLLSGGALFQGWALEDGLIPPSPDEDVRAPSSEDDIPLGSEDED